MKLISAALLFAGSASGAFGQTAVGPLQRVQNGADIPNAATFRSNIGAARSDGVNVMDSGAVCNGTTNDTAAFSTAAGLAVSAGKALVIPGGTCILDGWTLPTSPLTIQGAGMGATILKRKASASGNTVIQATSANGIRIYDLTLDGNKANNSTIGYSALFTTSYNITIDRMEVKNSKGAGAAIQFASTTDGAQGTRSEISNANIHDNDGGGIYFATGASNWTVRNNTIRSNGTAGITLINYVFPPVVGSFSDFAIVDNDLSYNGTGLTITSFITGGTSSSPTRGVFATAQRGTISRNTANYNAKYGLAVQGVGMLISNNTASYNGGVAAFYAGILANGSKLTIHGNTAEYNEYYGLDAGGSTYSKIHDNMTSFNGNATAGSGNGINCGACQHVDIEGNFASSNGTAASGIQIRVSLYDGPGITGQGFSTAASNITLRRNRVVSAYGVQVGIAVLQDPQIMVIEDNWSTGAGDNQAFQFQTTAAQIARNRQDTWLSAHSVGGANFFTYPDGVEELTVFSATADTVNTFWPYFYALYRQAVYKTLITSGGSGYTTGLTVSYSGGGCSTQPTGEPITDNAGVVVGVIMLTGGVGCSSAPVATIVDSAGIGAAATSYINPVNTFNGRLMRVILTQNLTVVNSTSAGNIFLNGGANFTVPSGQNVISVLRGWLGRWYEEGRYNNAQTTPLAGATGSIGGGALVVGACASGTVAITNSTTAMAVASSPVTYPGDGFDWMSYVSSAGTVTVKVCAHVAGTPTASAYNVRVVQ